MNPTKVKEEKSSMTTEICDVSAVKECFKKYPKDRQIHCKKELEEYKLKCSQLAQKQKEK